MGMTSYALLVPLYCTYLCPQLLHKYSCIDRLNVGTSWGKVGQKSHCYRNYLSKFFADKCTAMCSLITGILGTSSDDWPCQQGCLPGQPLSHCMIVYLLRKPNHLLHAQVITETFDFLPFWERQSHLFGKWNDNSNNLTLT